jgi:muramoyltetrapeptide carboxypeptidase
MTSLQNYLFLTKGYSFVHSPMLTSNAFLKPEKGELEAFLPTAQSRRINGKDASSAHLSFKLKLFSSKPVQKLPVHAPIIGGNLTCLAAILPVLNRKYPRSPFYLFLEEVSEKAYRVDRMLTLLQQSGFLKHCRGIFLGYFTDCPDWQGCLRSFSNDSKIPLWQGIPSGHDRPNISIPLGVKIEVRKSSKNFGTITAVFPKPQLAG